MNYVGEIVKILKNKKELLQKEDLKYIIELIAKEECLEDYIEEIRFGSNKNICASYVRKHKLLIINYETILNQVKMSILNDSTLGKNMLLLTTIFHEIEHIKQYKFIEDNSVDNSVQRDRLTLELVNGIEEALNKYEILSSQFGFMKVKDFFINLHSFNKTMKLYNSNKGYNSKFSEKLAQFNALEIGQILLKNIETTEAKDIYEKFEKEKYKVALEGYKDMLLTVKYPYKYFKKNIKYYGYNKNNSFSLEDNFEHYSLDEKLLLGYPITKEEYKIIKNKKK